MTQEEAVRLLALGQAGAVPAEELRRAYLRAVKRHKPEVDPAGFQRVREAFELLKAQAAMEAFERAAAMEEAPAIAVPAPPADPIAIPFTPPAPPVDHLAAYRERLQLLFGCPWPERVAVAREAYQAFPGDPAARHLLLDELPAHAKADIVAVLQDGVRAGDEACLRMLLGFAPGSAPDAELERLSREGEPSERLQVAEACLERNAPDRTLALLEEVLAPGDSGLPDGLTVDRALRLVMRFHRHGDPRAHAAFAAVERYLGPVGLAAGTTSAETTTMFALARELSLVPDLPPELVRECAYGALESNFDGVVAAVIRAESRIGKGEWRRVQQALAQKAPLLAALAGRPRPQLKASFGFPVGGVALALLWVVRWCWSSMDTPSTDPTALRQVVQEISQREQANVQLTFQAKSFCLAPAPRDQPLCENLLRLLTHPLGLASCDNVRRGMPALLSTRPQATLEGQALITRVIAHKHTICP